MRAGKIASIMFLIGNLGNIATTAFGAGSAVLELRASGSVGVAPTWQNSSGQDITLVDFSFATIAGAANQDVNSKSVEFKLSNAVSYPQNVGLVRPNNCKIDNVSVANSDVALVQDSTVISSDQNMSIPNGQLHSYNLRFAASGNYGDKSGAVTCAPGTLTFTF